MDSIYIHIYIYVCVCVYIYIYIHIVYVFCLSLSLSLYIYICVCVCVCVYIYIYIYISSYYVCILSVSLSIYIYTLYMCIHKFISASKEKPASSDRHHKMERKHFLYFFNVFLLIFNKRKKGTNKKTWVRSNVKNGCNAIVWCHVSLWI